MVMLLAWRPPRHLCTEPISRAQRKNKTQRARFELVPLISFLLVMLAACGGSSPPPGYSVSVIDNAFSPQVLHNDAILRVPEVYSTIQAAVNAAKPGVLASIGLATSPHATSHQ